MWQNDIHTGRHLTFPVPSLFGHFQPFGQGVHCSWRPCENVPPGQSVAVATVVDGQNFPSGQTVQACAFPTEYVPKKRKKDRWVEGRFYEGNIYCWLGEDSSSINSNVFSLRALSANHVTYTILVSQNMEQRLCWCSKPILWGLNPWMGHWYVYLCGY